MSVCNLIFLKHIIALIPVITPLFYYFKARKCKWISALHCGNIKEDEKNGAYGIRTRGLNNANVARSQLRQCPITYTIAQMTEKCKG